MFSLFGNSKRKRRKQLREKMERAFYDRLKAKYDASRDTLENAKHWSAADYLGPNAAMREDVRRKVRARARYETYEGNSYCKGIVTTKTNDCIGKGPRLQMLTGSRGTNARIEESFHAWMKRAKIPQKLRTMHQAKQVDGEGFGEWITNPRLNHDVKLDWWVTEADLWVDEEGQFFDTGWVEGIEYDNDNNPIRYKRYRHHPEDQSVMGPVEPLQQDILPAQAVTHWFRVDRPDQRRGMSELAPSLPLWAELRRYTMAVVAAAEIAADFAGVIESDASAFQDDPDEFDETFLTVDVEKRMLMTLPAGWKMKQLQAEQPTDTFKDFEEAIVKQAARVQRVPLNIATGSSRDSNFASARLDYILYWGDCDIERTDCETIVLDPMFRQWLIEETRGAEEELPHRWFWPRRLPIDEVKHAQAQKTLFDIGHLVDDEVFAELQVDPETRYTQMADMVERRREIGLPIPGVTQQEVTTDGSTQETESQD